MAIESSCDETSAAVLCGDKVLSNIIATQKVHEKYGGVVPELASRAHQVNILPVVQQALEEAAVNVSQLNAVAVTQGPGLMGSLLVGVSFAKSLSLSLNIPLIAVHHMKAHVLAHFIRKSDDQLVPEFPFLCLTVSGGHTQIVRVNHPTSMEVMAETIDDAAGEAFDKAAKVLGLPYPGGPLIDRHASLGDHTKYPFPIPKLDGLKYSFSGLKTSLLYFLRDRKAENPDFIQKELNHICASYQYTIVSYLLKNFSRAIEETGIHQICLAGGVSANSLLRKSFHELAEKKGCRAFIPDFQFCTDNAAMIGIAAYYQYLNGDFTDLNWAPKAHWKI